MDKYISIDFHATIEVPGNWESDKTLDNEIVEMQEGLREHLENGDWDLSDFCVDDLFYTEKRRLLIE